MNPRLDEALQLLSAGRRDGVAFRILHRDPNAPHEILLFHAQQAAEKFIKTVLAVRGVIYRRTHDLLELAVLAEQKGLVVPVGQDLLIRLGPYAVESRYLSVLTPTVENSEAALLIDTLHDWAAQIVQDASPADAVL